MEDLIWFAAVLGAFGLIVGSFLNSTALRVLNKEPVFVRPAACRHCGQRIRFKDLVPMVSYFVLSGKCRDCGEKISLAYPIGEAVTALLFAWVGWHYGPSNLEWVAALLLCSVMVVISQTDIKAMKIPNAIVFPAAIFALFVRCFIHPLPIWNYLAGAAIGFALLYLLAVLSGGGIGGGDMKLYLFIGLIGGIPVTLLSLLIASMLGSCYGTIRKLTGTLKRNEPIPFGPFIAIGAIFAFLYSERWIDEYMNVLLLY